MTPSGPGTERLARGHALCSPIEAGGSVVVLRLRGYYTGTAQRSPRHLQCPPRTPRGMAYAWHAARHDTGARPELVGTRCAVRSTQDVACWPHGCAGPAGNAQRHRHRPPAAGRIVRFRCNRARWPIGKIVRKRPLRSLGDVRRRTGRQKAGPGHSECTTPRPGAWVAPGIWPCVCVCHAPAH